MTKGTARERQVLDVLQMLPTRAALVKDVVIVDRDGSESPSFDGALIDREHLPLLWVEDSTAAVMIESAIACIEVKSTLDTGAITDIFEKANKLRLMTLDEEITRAPAVVGFAYQCANVNLAFFDYARRFHVEPSTAPTPICVLGQALFAGTSRESGRSRINPGVAAQAPVYVITGSDALLGFLYILFRRVTTVAPWAAVARTYSEDFFSRASGFFFEKPFLDRIVADEETANAARAEFAGHASEPIDQVYVRAKARTGL
ncbi:MAG: hypothetical protein M3P30_09340 [Chloroflexota bacterium]|nr:hypothetical protein [Chloroflexota bacterium]